MDDIDKLIATADHQLGQIQAKENEAMGMTPEPGQPGGPELVQPTNADAVAGLLMMAREMGVQAFNLQTPRATLNDDNVSMCAAAIGPALDYSGINLGGTVATNPWINAAFVAGPILWAATRGILQELEERKSISQARQAGQGIPYNPQPGVQPVSMADVAEMAGPNG